jgi:hypothetical protein
MVMSIGVLATNYAINIVVSDLCNVSYDEFYENLSDDHINEGVCIWHPYENKTASELLEIIDGYANMFIEFYN